MPKRRQSPAHVTSIILAGGAGKRLFPLTQDRSKPAVPLGGKYRLIDISISNSINSGLRKIFVLTQFNSASLNRHVTGSFNFDPFAGGAVEVLAAEQTVGNVNWFQGTADAVRQHLHRFTNHDADYQLVLAGDQLYRMDYQGLLGEHWETRADVTVCVIPRDEASASSFGLVKLDRWARIEQFREKPTGVELQEMRTDTTAFGFSPSKAVESPYLASMGIYLFNRKVLEEILSDESMNDFGHQVIPRAIERYDVRGYLFEGYWEDLGTIGAFYRANIDLTRSTEHFNFHDMSSPIFTRARFLPPSRVDQCEVTESILSEGSILNAARLANSIVGIRSVVRSGVILEEALVMGADFYEDEEDFDHNRRLDVPDIGIGENSVIQRAIIDKNTHIGSDVRILNEAGVQEADGDGFAIRDGIVIVPKNAVIPSGTII